MALVLATATGAGWIEVTARLAVAVVLGAVIGFDREVDGHEAGIRTHALIALGAGVFGAISVGGFGDYVGAALPGRDVDVSRVAAYVAAAIGFIGGGTIVKGPEHIRGLTTAASLWVVTAVGLACGVGYWPPAIVATACGVFLLLAERPLERLAERWRGDRERG